MMLIYVKNFQHCVQQKTLKKIEKKHMSQARVWKKERVRCFTFISFILSEISIHFLEKYADTN